VPRGESMLSQIEPGAVGSVLVLAVLIGAIGYGGWSVLQEVQRVQLAPIDQAPVVVAEIDPLDGVTRIDPLVAEIAESSEADPAALAEANTSAQPDLVDRLYRPQALDIPVMTSRDGPIAAINPRDAGTLASVSQSDPIAAAIDQALVEAGATDGVQVVADAAPQLEVLAVRPSWVRVQSADGTVLFEKVLDAGERYVVPSLEEAPVLRAGNSGSVYFAVNGRTYGPAAPGASVVKNLALSADALTQTFAEADLSIDADLAKFVNVAEVSPEATPVID